MKFVLDLELEGRTMCFIIGIDNLGISFLFIIKSVGVQSRGELSIWLLANLSFGVLVG